MGYSWSPSHPPYKLDLASSDFHLVRYLKNDLASNTLVMLSEISSKNIIVGTDSKLLQEGFQSVTVSYEDCFNKQGNDLEK